MTIRTIKELAANLNFDLKEEGGLQDARNAIWELVCGLSQEEMDYYLNKSDDWTSTGAFGSRAESLYPAFDDPSTLGDWDGYDLESVQQLCQQIFDF